MSEKNYGLELYKIIKEEPFVDEFGWVSTGEFYVWVSYWYLKEFVNKLKTVFGYGMFDDGDFNAKMHENSICIDLCEVLGDYLDIEDVFPKDKYQH